ncbi:MAG TPA: apolipoprotein N-acyltransferase [Hyphomicrobiaceae bacterium]|nr:apolipoprotein N-acyltransferase [Hyphomicrobiaceae bacterium]
MPNPDPTPSYANEPPPVGVGITARLACGVAAWATALRGLAGWRRWAAAGAAGATAVLAMAPFNLWPVLFFTLPALIWLIDGALAATPAPRADRGGRRALKSAAAVGWWFGFGYFVAGLYWIGAAFLVEPEAFAALLPLAVTGLPAGLALFPAAAVMLAAPFWRTGVWRVVALALALSATEYARGHVLTGFPWNLLGYALTASPSLLQSAALVGIYGLTLIAGMVFGMPLVLLAAAGPGTNGRQPRRLAFTIAVVPLLLAAVWGHVRLGGEDALTPGVKIRIVQPSVPQQQKWRPENQEGIFLDHLRLSASNAAGAVDNLAGITHVVWPEAAMPFLPLDQPAVRAAIGRLLPEGTLLLAGGLRAETAPPGSPRPRQFFNSLLVFGPGGSALAHYDKVHLVPFGEYLPAQAALEAIGLEQLTRLRGGFTSGPRPAPMVRVPGLPPVAPLICYEAIFPHAIAEAGERPALIVNLTNDGWFGNSTGPRQHLQQARVRAVEEGVPLLRVANNGISAMIDGHGRSLIELGLDQTGSVDTGLPAALPPTPYARFGDGIFASLWLLGAAALAVAARQRSRLAGA